MGAGLTPANEKPGEAAKAAIANTATGIAMQRNRMVMRGLLFAEELGFVVPSRLQTHAPS
jgi:hypothetical protein